MPTWVNVGIADYMPRIHNVDIEILEVSQIKRSVAQPVAKAIAQEGEKLLSMTAADDYIVALDESGKQITSEQLAMHLNQWIQDHRSVAFMIGGSDGLDPRCKEASRAVWSLSAMTFPHGLARLILVEQLYRAWTIVIDHPYHRN